MQEISSCGGELLKIMVFKTPILVSNFLKIFIREKNQ